MKMELRYSKRRVSRPARQSSSRSSERAILPCVPAAVVWKEEERANMAPLERIQAKMVPRDDPGYHFWSSVSSIVYSWQLGNGQTVYHYI